MNTFSYAYNVTAYVHDDEITVKTNSITTALDAFFHNLTKGVHTDILDGMTGEVLALANYPEGEDFCTDEMALMMVGHLMTSEWGEAEPAPEPKREEIPSIFEVMLALSAQQLAELGQTPEDGFMHPFVCPSDEDSKIVS